jgi:hypothetical protein
MPSIRTSSFVDAGGSDPKQSKTDFGKLGRVHYMAVSHDHSMQKEDTMLSKRASGRQI